MNRAIFSISILLLFVASFAIPPAPASDIVKAAEAQAARENKSVMILFHASWCGWCHKMEGVFEQTEVKKIINKYFVIRWLTVMETDAKKSEESPGGKELMETHGGKDTGIPFFYFTDAKGKMLINSIAPAEGANKGGNIGCPFEPNEIAYFMKMVSVGAPKMTIAEMKVIRLAFEALKKAGG